MLTGIGWGITSLVKASKVLPAIIGQFSAFAQVIRGELTISLATLQTVALPLIGVLSALGVAIYAIVGKARKNKQAVDEMSSSAIRFKESIDNLNKSATEEKTKIEANATAAETYIKRIQELDDKLYLNNVEQAEYRALLQKIVEIMPSVASAIDLQNGKIIDGTTALNDQITAWKNLALQQARQEQITNLYKQKADIELQLAEQRVKLAGLETEYEPYQRPMLTSESTGGVYSIFDKIKEKLDPDYKKRQALGSDILNTREAINNLEAELYTADRKLKEANEALLDIYASEEKVGVKITKRSMSDLEEAEKEITLVLGNLDELVTKTTAATIEDITEEIKFSIDEYISASEKYITRLTSEYNLLELQGASQEELTAKIKEIQDERHKEAEILREVLENVDILNLTTEDTYEIETKINEYSIDWWNWQNKIKDDAEEIKEDYEDISDVLLDLFAAEKEELNNQKEAIVALASEMSDYYDTQLDNLDKEIDALKEANEEVENQISLQQKSDALANAKQKKVLVYKDGRLQYLTDTDAVSSASKDLADYQRQQELQKQISKLEEQKNAINDLKSSWSNMVSDYEKEQDRWLISQQLGINTAIEGWQNLVGEASVYAEQYKQIMTNLANIEVSESRLKSEEELDYDPNVDYHALMLQATSAEELAHWAKLREAKIKGEGITPDKSTADIIRDWSTEHSSYAGGTLSANGGLSLVGEHGAELRVLNNGDGIIPSNMTSNLMAWGSMTPNQFKMQSLGNFGRAMQVTIQALNLPNVSDGIGFVDYVRNNMFGQVLSFVH